MEELISEHIDLRGVRCPLNWAKAKIRLEQMDGGQSLEILLDDPKAARDLPRAAEAEGYVVLDVEQESMEWRIVIEK
ncbi:MAG: sulfurtransferase TusA family protein [Deltaproteobacteria bacterium]|nr:sulfurtransferase TusA family protein [Deltaproteobacteria bacterium]